MLDVERAAFLCNFGQLELERGRYAKARECFEKTAALAPEKKQALMSLAIAQALGGDLRAAKRTLAKAGDGGYRHYAEAVASALGVTLDLGIRPGS
jgi:Flp pilus assembly protein TadD